MYIRYSVGRGRRRGKKRKRKRGGEESLELCNDFFLLFLFLRLTSQSIFDNRENGLPYFTYVVTVLSLFRLSQCFCISIVSLYLLGKYNVVLAIVVVLSNSI